MSGRDPGLERPLNPEGSMDMNPEHKVVLITGCSYRVGAVFARGFAQRGYRVVIQREGSAKGRTKMSDLSNKRRGSSVALRL